MLNTLIDQIPANGSQSGRRLFLPEILGGLTPENLDKAPASPGVQITQGTDIVAMGTPGLLHNAKQFFPK